MRTLHDLIVEEEKESNNMGFRGVSGAGINLGTFRVYMLAECRDSGVAGKRSPRCIYSLGVSETQDTNIKNPCLLLW